MKKLRIIFLLFCFTKIVAQINLVPNPSFENYTICPTNLDEFNNLVDWEKYGETPDFFSPCNTSTYVGVPRNIYAFQDSIAACNHNYVGIGIGTNLFPGREAIGCKLKDSLIKNSKYYFSMKINLADTSNFASNNLGMKLYYIKPFIDYSFYTWYHETNSCTINFNNVEQNKTVWVKKFGSFIADSNYKYLLISNFYENSQTSYSQVANYPSSNFAYYFIDDVCLSTDSAYAYNYAFNCGTITNYKFDYQIPKLSVFPNPTTNFLKIEGTYSPIISITIKNQQGITIKTFLDFSVNNYLDLSDLSSGLYFLTIVLSDKSINNMKVIINQN